MTEEQFSAIPDQPNYFWHWILLLLPVAVGIYFLPQFTHAPLRDSMAPRVVNGNADWFLLLKMPEVPVTDKATVKLAQAQFGRWLDAMSNAGFQPMLLSEVIARRKQKLGLPEKTVVLSFDPGYRATYEALNPVLEQHGFPAVWLTHAEPLTRHDFRYVSTHLANQMRRSGRWDVALYQDPQKIFVLTGAEENQISAPLSWAAGANWQARNHFNETDGLHRLALRPQWTPRDLIDQLSIEVPFASPSHLYVKELSGRARALTSLVKDAGAISPFDLASNQEKRVNMLFWPSTEGQRDFTVDLSVQKVAGELWLFLRSDEKMTQGIRVGITKDVIAVEQDRIGEPRKELLVHHMTWPKDAPLACKIAWVDNNFKLQINGQTILKTQLPAEEFSPAAKFGMMVYDRIRGSAQANQIDLTFTPLSKDLIKILQSYSAN